MPTTTRAPVVLVSDDQRQASYVVQSASVTVDLVAAESCWVQISSGDGGGPVTFAGVLQAGDSKVVASASTSGGASVRVCNPAAVSLSVDGTPMAVPQLSGGQPYTLVFAPA